MSKYSFTLTAEIRSFVEFKIRTFHEDRAQLATLKDDLIPSAIPKYGPTAGGFDPEQRPTEDIAEHIINNRYVRQLELTVNAIQSVYDALADQDKELIRLKYWSNQLTPDGIAMKLNIDRSTVYDRLNKILVEIARRLGYVDL